MLDDYQGGVSRWIQAVTAPGKTGKLNGLFEMIHQANKKATEGNSICNLGAAALVLRYLLKVHFFWSIAQLAYSCAQHRSDGDSEFLVQNMSKALRSESENSGDLLYVVVSSG